MRTKKRLLCQRQRERGFVLSCLTGCRSFLPHWFSSSKSIHQNRSKWIPVLPISTYWYYRPLELDGYMEEKRMGMGRIHVQTFFLSFLFFFLFSSFLFLSFFFFSLLFFLSSCFRRYIIDNQSHGVLCLLRVALVF